MKIENQLIRGGFVLRNCTILVKRGHTGILIEGCEVVCQPSWRHPVRRLRFWWHWFKEER